MTELFQDWENGEWINMDKCEYVFLTDQINVTTSEWDGSNWTENAYNYPIYAYMEGEPAFFCFAINLELFYTNVSGFEESKTSLENPPILCYPNPVIDQLNLEIDPAWQAKNYRLELFSQTGQKLKSFEISSDIGSSMVPNSVEEVPPGLYLLRIEAGKQVFTQKIIISE